MIYMEASIVQRNIYLGANIMTKQEQTKQAIRILMEASNPCTMQDIVKECKEQAYAGFVVKAIKELQNEGFMYYDQEFKCFDLV